MSFEAGDGFASGRNAGEGMYIDAEIGSPIRVRRSGVAFEVSRGAVPRSPQSPLRTKRLSNAGDRDNDVALTAEQLSEKLASAEARREMNILDTKNRCAEHNIIKVGKAREQRTLMERQQSEGLKEAIDEEMEKAQKKVAELRLARLAKLRHKEIRHEELLNQQHENFEAFVRKLDAKYTDKVGNRNRVLAEMVEKMKEHNARVKQVHDMVFSGVDGSEQNQLAPQEEPTTRERDWVDAYNQRDEYMRMAREQLRQEELDMEFNA